jgi:ferrous iron transport protein B
VNAVLTAEAPASVVTARIALLGNPNTGKTTLFNALCGVRAKTSNYPGTTTSIRTGGSDAAGHVALEVVDIPGIYDLRSHSAETRIARDVLERGRRAPDAVVLVLDAGNLTRNLVLAGEVLSRGVPTIVALNMVDLARRRGINIDTAALARRLKAPVVAVVARTHEGLGQLRNAIDGLVRTRTRSAPPPDLPPSGSTIEALTAWAESVTAEAALRAPARDAAIDIDRVTERLDRAFTHPALGMLTFVAIMCGLFWTLFTLAAVPMDLIEAVFGSLGSAIKDNLPDGPVRDLLTDGIVGGIAGTVVFLPQICLLFFLISILEDTGYLARAAFVMHGVLSRFGLPGHAFVPLLTSHACAIPGIMSTRLIQDQRDRLATILIAPFMSCSARLPVYVLLTSLLFVDSPLLAGAVFVACYVLGAGAGLLTATIFGRTLLKGKARPMVLELPSYRVPSLTNALLTAKDQGLAFLRTAGTVIVAICIVMWWLSAYPRANPDADARTAQAASYAGQLGHAIQPVFEPVGFDWQLTVGVLTSFLAREVFVSTISVLEGGAGDADVDAGVVERISNMRRDDGTKVFTPAAAASALVFFVLAMQCLPTLAVTRKETGSFKYAALQLTYMSTLAYVAAFFVYQGLRAAGVS